MKNAKFRLVAGTLFGLTLVILGAGFVFLFKTVALKERVVKSLENDLDARVDLSSLQIDFWHQELRAKNISLISRKPSAPWQKANIGEAVAHFHLVDLFATIIPIQVTATSWSITLSSDSIGGSNALGKPSAGFPESNSQDAFKITQIAANDGEVDVDLSNGEKAVIEGVTLNAATVDGAQWKSTLTFSAIKAGTFVTGTGSVGILADQNQINFSDLHIQCEPGWIDGSGEIHLNSAFCLNASLKAKSIPINVLVATQWQIKLGGLASGELAFHADNQTATAAGQIKVTKGKCNLLPFIGKISALVNLPNADSFEFDTASSTFTWKSSVLDLTEIDVRKSDVCRMAGELRIDSRTQVEGEIKLGFPSATLARWPALRDRVFYIQFEDFNWANIHLTGPLDLIQEDLTPRLLAVSADQGDTLLNEGAKKAFDLLKALTK